MSSLNIQRGRDHGLPGYAAYRGLCSNTTVTAFSQLASVMEPGALARLATVYRSDWTAGHYRPPHYHRPPQVICKPFWRLETSLIALNQAEKGSKNTRVHTI